MMSVETRIAKIIGDVINCEGIEDAFSCFMVHNGHQQKVHDDKSKWYQENVCNVLNNLAPETKLTAVKYVIDSAGQNCNEQRIRLLFSILEFSVNNNAIGAKTVCECLLASPKLIVDNQDLWCESFNLMKRIIGGVDYKGVRDLMKALLEKAALIPVEMNVSILPQVYALVQIIEYIFDRNTCLLPSYFIVNEVQKMFPDYNMWPHWKLAQLLSDFCDSFLPVAQMVSIAGRCKLMPIVGYSTIINMWKLDNKTLRFPLHGLLPYKKELIEPQTELLKFVIEQPYSNDIVCNMLGLNKKNKQRCAALEEQLVDLVVLAMEKSENENENATEDGSSCQLLWQHLSSQLIFFVLFQFARFPHMVNSLHAKLLSKNLKKGRDHLMWVLLQFISGSIQNNSLSDFLPVLSLYDLLYPEKELIAVPNTEKACSTRQMAVTCIWIHLMRKAQTEQVSISRAIPHALKNHVEYLQQNLMSSQANCNIRSDYRIALLCNAYSTNNEYFMRPLQVLLESIHVNQKTQTAMPGNCMAAGPTQPLSVEILDSLTVHAKMSLIHGIVSNVIKLAQAKSNVALAPALVETYSRLLVYTEIESLGVKGFIGQLLPTVFKSHAYGILHTLLEMFSYRLHHIQPHYRVQLLSHLHSLASVPQTNQTQLHLCVESTALRLITGLGSSEVQPQFSRFLTEPKTLISAESEELNRALVLTLARAMYVTGSETLSGTWCKDILSTIMQNTPHTWSSYTLNCFPPVLAEIFQQHQQPKEDMSQLKTWVEEEYRKWKSMSNESDIIAHFSLQGTPPLFLCLLWKMLLENDQISAVAYKVLERVGARSLSAHLRTLADFLVHEFSVSAAEHVKKCIEALNGLIWKCNVITLDRLVLCLALRSFEGNEAQVCFFIIKLLLLKPQDFRNRVNDFIKHNSPEHWKQSNWHDKHLAFHKKYPEKYNYEGEHCSQSSQPYLPVYFGNICLRFLPVFDIVIHRFLELPSVGKSLENLLDQLGSLYKFHDRPITYLYNTLHYYERKLKDRCALKKKIVSTIIGAQRDIRPKGWCLTDAYESYIDKQGEDVGWTPDAEYYTNLVAKLVITIGGKLSSQFSSTDWRFNEFPNASVHVLHCICIELMALPVDSATIGCALMDVARKGHTQLQRSSVESWMNCIALIITALPDTYWLVLHSRIVEMLQSPLLASATAQPAGFNLTQVLDFSTCHQMYREMPCSYLLALAHAIWHHSTIGQISKLPQFIKNELKPIVKTEEQYVYVCHLVAPFLLRFNTEWKKCVMEITVELYEMLENVDKACEHMQYMDCICDLLYHIKYMYTGDSVKTEAERVIRNLRPALQLRLRFITHLNIKEVLYHNNDSTSHETH